MRFPASRLHSAIVVAANALVPGTGLVLLGRERTGFFFAVVFTIALQTALWGFLLIPAVIPHSVATIAVVTAGISWVAAQWTMALRLRAVGVNADAKIRRLLVLVSEAMEDQQYAHAHALLQESLAIWDDDAEIYAEWARLMTLMGRFATARLAWERVLELDSGGMFRVEAITALERLPAE